MAHELGNIKRKQNSPYIEIVHETTWNSAFCLALYLTGEHFRGVTARWWRQWAKNQSWPIRTREVGGVTLSEVRYVYYYYLILR